QRVLGRACTLGDLTLGAPLAAKDRGDVNGGRCNARWASTARKFALACLPEDLDSPALDLTLQVQARAEARYIVDRRRRQELEPEFTGDEPVGTPDLLSRYPGDLCDLVERPGHAALAARCIERRCRNTLDTPAADQVLVNRVAVDHRCSLTHVPGQPERRRHPVQLRERKRQVPLGRVRDPDT